MEERPLQKNMFVPQTIFRGNRKSNSINFHTAFNRVKPSTAMAERNKLVTIVPNVLKLNNKPDKIKIEN